MILYIILYLLVATELLVLTRRHSERPDGFEVLVCFMWPISVPAFVLALTISTFNDLIWTIATGDDGR